MAMFSDPFDACWVSSMRLIHSEPAIGSARPERRRRLSLLNVFRKGDDYAVIAELPGVQKSDLEIQVKGNTIRVAGTKPIDYGEKVSLHRRERLWAGSTAPLRCRSRSMPIAFRPNTKTASWRCCCRAERDKPRSIKLS